MIRFVYLLKIFFVFYQVKLVNTIRIFRVVSLFNFQCSLLYIFNKFQHSENLFSNVLCCFTISISIKCNFISIYDSKPIVKYFF